MARIKLTEYRAKKLLLSTYEGISTRLATLDKDTKNISRKLMYAVKVDQGLKKRGKQGLVKLHISASQVKSAIQVFSRKGFDTFLVEPMLSHVQDEEHYLSIERVRDGFRLIYSPKGGVEIEDTPASLKTYTLPRDKVKLGQQIPLKAQWLDQLILTMNTEHVAFVEINPLVIQNKKIFLLDATVLADDAGEHFAHGWSSVDSPNSEKLLPEEEYIAKLDANTPAALKLKVLNPDGSIWTLLSGGGASITIADEVQAAGIGTELGSYGEYSGGPTTEETYLYTKAVVSLMLKAKTRRKALVIAGGVANFTDVKSTFAGIIQALEEKTADLKKASIKVFVRRGGPNEAAGLALMKGFLSSHGLLGSIAGSNALLTDAITDGIAYIKKGTLWI